MGRAINCCCDLRPESNETQFWHLTVLSGCHKIPRKGKLWFLNAFIGCSLTPASIWANFEHYRLFFDRDMPFSVSSFFTDWLKSQIAPNFVTFHWPTTPYNANMRILAAEVVHDWPGFFLSHLVIKFLHFESNPRMEGRWKVPILPVLDTCLVPSSVLVKPIFEAQQSDTGQRLCTSTHEAYSSTTWLGDKNQ